MSQTRSNHESNRVESWVEQGRIMTRTGSNHESNRIESWVEQGRIISRTGSNHETNTVKLWVEQGRTNHESNKVESWIEQGRIMNRTRSYHWSSRVEVRVKHGRFMGRTSSNFESNRVICFNFTSILLNVQHILLDWNTNPKINIGSMKSLAWACSKVRSYPGWGVRCNFCLKLRRSNEHYCRTKSNHGTNSVESWVEQGR